MDEETKKARYSREVEQSLRQFLNHDGPKGSKEAYREGWDRIFGKKAERTNTPHHFHGFGCSVNNCPDAATGIVEEAEDQPGQVLSFLVDGEEDEPSALDPFNVPAHRSEW